MQDRTEAWLELKRLTANDPSWHGNDRLSALLAMIPAKGVVQLTIRGGAVIGRTALGEVGVSAPNATTRHFADASAMIVFNSGLLAFVHVLVHTFMAAATVTHSGGESEPVSLPMQAVDQGLVTLYRQWPQLWQDDRLRTDPILLTPGAAEIAARIRDVSLLFLLLHEYGHAVKHADLDLDQREPRHELEADAWALQSLITAYALPQNQMRLSLMGAVVAIRAWSALAALGHRFPTHYPAPAERFAAILGQFRDMCADEYTYYYYGTIAVAHDQRMEAAERVFKGLEYTPAITSERLISTAMAMLIEVQSGRRTTAQVGNDIGFMLDRATPAVRAEAEATARRVFTADAVQYGQAATAVGRQTTAIVDGYWTLMQSFAPDTPIEKPTGVH